MPPKRKQASEKKKAPPPPKEEEEEEESSSSGEEEEDSDDSSLGPENEDGDEEDVDGEAGDEEEIQVDFEFFDPKEMDFHGLKTLLVSYLDGAEYNSGELCDLIINQPTVGTVIKTELDAEDPLGVLTVFPLDLYKSSQALKQVLAWIQNKCTDDTIKGKLSKALGGKGVGLIVSERMMNSPPQLATPLLEGLCEEVEWATEDEPTAERRGAFKMGKYIVVARAYRDPEAEAREAMPPPGKKAKNGKPKVPSWIWIRPEDEYLHEVCEWSYGFDSRPANAEPRIAKDELLPGRVVMLVDAKRVPEARNKLKSILPMPE